MSTTAGVEPSASPALAPGLAWSVNSIQRLTRGVTNTTGDILEPLTKKKTNAATKLQAAMRAKKAREEVEKKRAHENSIFTKSGRFLGKVGSGAAYVVTTPIYAVGSGAVAVGNGAAYGAVAVGNGAAYVVTAPVYAVGGLFSSPAKTEVEA